MMAERKVAIIDGGGANIASLNFALDRLGWTGELTMDTETIRRASHVILPGVGAAKDAMNRLIAKGIDQCIRELQQPVLGICLGLQLLLDASEENDSQCLGVVPGTARKFETHADRPVPHMGWNNIIATRDSALLNGIPDGTYFYFVHSYALPVCADTLASTDYGLTFSAMVERNNYSATQFHPERSGPFGARILKNFLNQ
jgi:glutamine amidotransferase